MSTKRSFSWALLVGVLGLAGCGPVSIRALTPAADGSVDTDATTPPGRCSTNDQCGLREYCAGNGCGTLGTCAARPDACPAIYGPVCGCDGRTYGNSCEAASSGARVATQGECGAPTDGGVDGGPGACVSSSDCGRGDTCVYPDNACARSGSCQPSIACVRAETFCACTGETYEGCVPDRPTRARGACASVDAGVDAGPARCTSNDQCGRGQYCAGTGCGTAGSCVARPEACTLEYAPVCGCDGRTHGNACGAASAGVRVAYRGACGAPVDAGVDAGPAGCVTSTDCGGARICVYPDNACARSGSCQLPTPCFRPEPFCSCTGETYEGCAPDRPTRARGACASVDAGVDAGPVRCTSNDQCERAQYCAGTGCGTPGTCAVRPQACPEIYSPTCGCDGRTYGNPCEAAGNGVRVASAGPCATPVDAGPAGCVTSRDCATGNTCVYPDGACARSGSCQPTIMCFRAEPFCACTGETYLGCVPDRPTRARGACATVDAGVSRCAAVLCGPGMACCEATGACYDTRCLACCMPVPPTDAGTPGCGSNSDCAPREYCAASGCGARGVCATRPEACLAIYDPVCGCDGRSYSSACVANGQGVNVASRGVCR